jgi:hypothetical protein
MNARRIRRTYLRKGQAAVLALVAVTLTAGSGRPDPYAPPGPLPPLAASTLDARYTAVLAAIEQARATAERAGDDARTRALTGFLRPGRRFLSFDPRGAGQAVEVIGDLAGADRVAIVVPGADGSVRTFDSWKFAGAGARALYERARRDSPGVRLAVIAWLGYDPPETISTDVLTDGRATHAAGGLRRLVAGVHRVNGTAAVGLLCHSYGAVVCGAAAGGLAVDDIALYGSPGVPAGSVAALRTPARVWAGRAAGDWMAYVPHVRVLRLGFGTDPVSPRFGARVFAAGSGAHGDYLRPGSVSLRNLALIALGRGSEVTDA